MGIERWQGASRTVAGRVIAAISNSGLRGRGDAGSFPGANGSLRGPRPAPVKYVISDGDEGDPRAFASRVLLESDPHRVLEGWP